MKEKLLIIMYDYLNKLVNKGEVVKRYYNPGNYFDEIHFLLINQKDIKKNKLSNLVGNAKFFTHKIEISNIDKFLCLFNLAFISSNLRKHLTKVLRINPTVVRCYNLNYQIFLAEYIYKISSIPYVISIHYDLQDHINKWNKKKKFLFNIFKFRLNKILKNSEVLLPVYQSATRYLKKHKIDNYKICYNFINVNKNKNKNKRKKDNIFNLICVNRQFVDKNPINIIKAVEEIPNIMLTLVGDGDYHERLKKYVKLNNLSKRIYFIKKINNEYLTKNLCLYDLYISNNYLNEFSKGMIEAISNGLPIVVNKRSYSVPEVKNSFTLKNKDTVKGYKNSINKIIKNKNLYTALSKSAKQNYIYNFETMNTEIKQKNIYKNLIKFQKL